MMGLLLVLVVVVAIAAGFDGNQPASSLVAAFTAHSQLRRNHLSGNSCIRSVSSWSQPRPVKATRSADIDATQTAANSKVDIGDLEDDQQDQLTSRGLLKRDRYMVTNRFAVRSGQEAKFEKRWATRKSRLATLPGFRYFHLMRRVKIANHNSPVVYDGGIDDATSFENYASFTVWEKKSDFSAWRRGDAFKEAHGGTSIVAFVSTMINSAMVLRGAPRPAFYDAMHVKSTIPISAPKTVDGWRVVEADGIQTLPPECFVLMEKYFVSPAQASTFEQLKVWSNRQTCLEQSKGMVAFALMRRDGQVKGHGSGPPIDTSVEPTYVAMHIFNGRPQFEAWSNEMLNSDSGIFPDASVLSKPMEQVLYEGTLVITSNAGA